MHMVAYKPILPACLQHHAGAILSQALPMPPGQAAATMVVLPVAIFALLCVTLGTVDLSTQHATWVPGIPPCKENVLQMVCNSGWCAVSQGGLSLSHSGCDGAETSVQHGSTCSHLIKACMERVRFEPLELTADGVSSWASACFSHWLVAEKAMLKMLCMCAAGCSGNPNTIPTNGTWPSSCNGGSTAHDSTCTAICDLGYSGSINATCSLGTWSTALTGTCNPSRE